MSKCEPYTANAFTCSLPVDESGKASDRGMPCELAWDTLEELWKHQEIFHNCFKTDIEKEQLRQAWVKE